MSTHARTIPKTPRIVLAVIGALALLAGLWAALPEAAKADESAFADDFSNGADAWTTSGGAWSADSGAYRQTDTEGNARAFAGDTDWTDLSVEATVRPLSVSGSSGFAALLGRVQGDQSYYYLTLRGNGQFEINKLVDGSRTLLDARPLEVANDVDHRLRLEITGDRLVGSLDGEELLSATDAEFASGRIGLKTFNAGASFGEVSVTTAQGGGEGSGGTDEGASAGSGDEGGADNPVAAPNDTPIGYAAMNGGTDGGLGGSPVNTHNLSEYAAQNGYSPADGLYQLLYEHIRKPGEGLIVHVDTKVSESDFSRSKFDVKDVSNVSILGTGDGGEIEGIGFTVSRAENIVFRNLNIHHVRQGEGTAIEVTNDSRNIWIDHNEFHSELDGQPDKDHYDGLVDVKRGAEYVTVSWNYFHDHWKTMLVGHTDNASLAPDRITYHHNYFRNVNSRVPLVRYADVHLLNNVMEDVTGSATNARNGARIMIEGNHYTRVGSGNNDTHANQIEGPVGWWYGSGGTGYWNLRDNTFVDTPHEHLSSTTDWTPPYAYEADSPEVARQRVLEYAGVGKVDVTP